MEKTVLAKLAAGDMAISSVSISILAFILMASVSVLLMATTVVSEPATAAWERAP
jgi:hypothetical protein